MTILFAALHVLGSKPLMVSVLAQIVVLGIAIKTKDSDRIRMTLIILVALALVLYSLSLRPPSPPNHEADILGSAASLLFLEPAVQAIRSLRRSSSASKS